MKRALLKGLERLGHFQARVLLTLFYFAILTPYALLVRVWKRDLLPQGRWQEVEDPEATLENLRRSF